jgi:neurotransmitter:Na+ symporter, NSS family
MTTLEPGDKSGPPQWSSRYAFLMAAVGAAVGLGNLWRFPFQTGQNGGSAFVLVYLICVAFIVYPILVGEIAIGRRKGLSAVGSTRELAKDVGASPLWGVIGLIGIMASYMVLTTYSVIAGRIISYSVMSFAGEFVNTEPEAPRSLYNGPVHAVFWHSIFMGLTALIVARGLIKGVERMVTILMPVFFIMLAGLSVYAMSTGAAGATINYLFAPRFNELTPDVVLAAMGQAFYSMAVGAAGMITYGAYLNRKENIVENSAMIAAADTTVALVAGLMIFPVVFAYSLDPAAGMGLIFSALPAVFAGLPAGPVISGMFFFLAFIAALTSSVSMLLVTAVFIEEWWGWGRVKSVAVLSSLAWAAGAASVSVHGLAEMIDFLAGNIFLPLGGLLGAIFVGWIVPRAVMRDELHNSSNKFFSYWRFLIRYLAPVAVAVILVLGIAAKF